MAAKKSTKKRPSPRALSRDPRANITLVVNDAALNSSNKVFTVPAGEEWEILSMFVELVTDATVGNRQVTATVSDNVAAVIAEFDAGLVQAASLTRRYTFGKGLPKDAAVIGTRVLAPLQDDLVLPPGYTIRVRDSAAIAAATDDMTVRVQAQVRRPTS